ncbi:uncharacterized protein PG998_010781 [Apiospora kogelbergensis]|uniref:uncharacterized protein n=1 Tax=Apiospora kogelbergensis TaxID=1337665 RepID=UPI0031325B2E
MIRPRHPTNLRLLRALAPSHSLSSRNATIAARYIGYCAQQQQQSQPRPTLSSPQWQQRSFATTPARFEVRNSEPNKPSPIAVAAEGPKIPAVEEPIQQQEEAQQQQQPPAPRRRRRGLIYAVVFACFGATVGSLFRLSISPPPLPAPGTPEDRYVMAGIHERAAKLPIVRELSADPAWQSWHAYEDRTNSEEKRRGSVTAGALSGSKALAYQRVFWNPATGELVNVVYFGGGTSGWPGVVHGGALATVLDETLGRCAILRFPSRTGVTARLELNYKKPTVTNAFYTDGKRKSDRKLWVQGHVEAEDGRVCVEARALFVVPKGVNLAPLDTRW